MKFFSTQIIRQAVDAEKIGIYGPAEAVPRRGTVVEPVAHIPFSPLAAAVSMSLGAILAENGFR